MSAISAATPAPAAPVPAGLFSIGARQWLILLMVQLTTLLFGMSITIANVVLPQMRGTLSATQDEISWVITLNLIATAVGTPITGWLATRLGWRNLLFFSVGGFAVFSFLCGVAGSLEALMLYRIGQGAFGAPIMPMGQAILIATFPRHLHATVMVIWGIGSVVGPVAGPIFGATIAEIHNWRGAFFMIVPPAIAAMICVWFALSGHTERGRTKLDWTGFIALSVAMAAAQLVLDRGQRMDWFEAPEIVVLTVLALLAFWVFACHCLTAREPFLDPRLLTDRNFAVGLVLSFFMGMLSVVSLVLFPALLHDLRGYPDSAIGLLIAARGIGNWLAFFILVPFTRRAPRLALATGLAAQTLAGWSMAQLDINVSGFDVFWTNVLNGFGFGLAYTPMAVLTFTTLAPKHVTEGTAIFTLLRNFGSSVFVSIAVVLLVRSTATNYAHMTEFVSPFNETLALGTLPASWTLDTTGGLARLANEIQRQAAMIGYVNAFYLMALTSAAAIPLVCLMRPPPRAA
jgi:DHA2 family multidrug resistance protein